MNINIKLDKNFTMQFNKLYNEFGTELAKLNGFADEQLSYTDFIDNFGLFCSGFGIGPLCNSAAPSSEIRPADP